MSKHLDEYRILLVTFTINLGLLTRMYLLSSSSRLGHGAAIIPRKNDGNIERQKSKI